MADLLFCQFGFSSFVMLKLSTDLLKWLNPNYKTGGYLTVILPIANKEFFHCGFYLAVSIGLVAFASIPIARPV